MFKKIDIRDIPGFQIGSAEYEDAATGCTVIICRDGAVTGLDVRGGAPASRESALLNPLAANESVNAVLLSGGSAFGLSAADGVMTYLEERNIGFPTEYGKVPIVCASCLFDLGVGRNDVRPDAALGRLACQNSETNQFREGSYGAGTGASVGKIRGPLSSMKSGLGIYAVQCGDLMVGAIAAVNAVGDIYDYRTGRKLAGCYDPKTREFIDSEEAYFGLMQPDLFNRNTTICAVITNAEMTKAHASKAASMAHDGMARTIRPVHTTFDGDSIYVMAHGSVKADVNAVGILASYALSEAIMRAARPQGNTYGLNGGADF